MATKPRIYTSKDEVLEGAMETVVEAGLIPADATASMKLRTLALHGAEQLIEERERAEKIAAYEELARDEERLEAITAWNRAAAEDGLI
jgi:hypothetical protein